MSARRSRVREYLSNSAPGSRPTVLRHAAQGCAERYLGNADGYHDRLVELQRSSVWLEGQRDARLTEPRCGTTRLWVCGVIFPRERSPRLDTLGLHDGSPMGFGRDERAPGGEGYAVR